MGAQVVFMNILQHSVCSLHEYPTTFCLQSSWISYNILSTVFMNILQNTICSLREFMNILQHSLCSLHEYQATFYLRSSWISYNILSAVFMNIMQHSICGLHEYPTTFYLQSLWIYYNILPAVFIHILQHYLCSLHEYPATFLSWISYNILSAIFMISCNILSVVFMNILQHSICSLHEYPATLSLRSSWISLSTNQRREVNKPVVIRHWSKSDRLTLTNQYCCLFGQYMLSQGNYCILALQLLSVEKRNLPRIILIIIHHCATVTRKKEKKKTANSNIHLQWPWTHYSHFITSNKRNGKSKKLLVQCLKLMTRQLSMSSPCTFYMVRK